MILISIDPGINGSGVCLLENGELVTLKTLRTWELYPYILMINPDKVVVENSNLIKSNWHGSTGRANVGKNQSISQEIVDFCTVKGFDVVEVKPDGYSKTYEKSFGAKLFEAETGYRKRTNKDERAAYAIGMRYLKTRKCG